MQGQSGFFQGGFKTGPALLPGGSIQQRHADIAGNAAALCQHMGCDGPGSPGIVMIDRAAARKILAQHHHRHVEMFQHSLVLRCVDRCNEDDAVHGVLTQGVQCAQLLFDVVGGVDEQQLIAGFFQHAADAFHHAGAAVAGKLGQNDADLPGAAGAQHLRLRTGVVAGGFHCGFDHGTLVGAEVSAVEVAAHGGLGDPGVLCKFGDVHGMPP